MTAAGVDWVTVELDAGETVPPLTGFDALLAFGGPMDVWQEAEHPWLLPEKTAIRAAVRDHRLPFLGICLGHQLLAAALGGEVGPMTAPEVGLTTVELTTEGRESPLFAGLDHRSACFQWHGSEVKRLPEGARILAQNAHCPVQAFAVGACAFGLQYHVELTPATVGEWGCVPEYAQALETTLGAGALARLNQATAAALPDLERDAALLFANFLGIVRAAAD
ncbi:MAG: type 1 glutamine amidotransferase [Alphaproteobacteria bacterium]|nr:type 1 glutamine amidotransferase [Alphaproteobacteria bacterium]